MQLYLERDFDAYYFPINVEEFSKVNILGENNIDIFSKLSKNSCFYEMF